MLDQINRPTDCEAKNVCTEKGGYCTKDCPDGQHVPGLCEGQGCVCCFSSECSAEQDCTDIGGYCTHNCIEGTEVEGLCTETGCRCCVPPRECRSALWLLLLNSTLMDAGECLAMHRCTQ
ncbi:hypothetical protein E2C01_093155 [Portunus trituberculatus]|uniref:Uncharacterized protein n=1 Tax=Portunus trituberculatus TaxID=210409 RepID=A0A5B7JM14_PORTR|nr:hypothetical protein [Portunus trituberculatus]